MKTYDLHGYDRSIDEKVHSMVRKNGDTWEEIDWDTNTYLPIENEDLIEALEEGGEVEGSLGWEMSEFPFTMTEVSE